MHSLDYAHIFSRLVRHVRQTDQALNILTTAANLSPTLRLSRQQVRPYMYPTYMYPTLFCYSILDIHRIREPWVAQQLQCVHSRSIEPSAVQFPDEHIQTLKDAANSSLQSEGDKVEKESAEMVRCPRRSESLWVDNYVARL